MGDKVYLSRNKKRLTGLLCPSCGAQADGATSCSAKDAKPLPAPGCMGICSSCGVWLMYTESFATYRSVSLRLATRAEVDNWRNTSDWNRRMALALEKIGREIKGRKG